MESTPSALLRMRRIRKTFAGNEVLHGVDFDLHAGEVHALLGHNGAGKSTLMKVLAGLYDDYEGEIEVAGQALRLTSPGTSLAAGIAVIHQEFSQVPTFDAAENLALGHEPRKSAKFIDRAELHARAKALIDELGFAIPLDVPVGKLSVAHQQLVEVAKALSRDARILVMDEPTSRLAPPERQTLFRMIAGLAARGVGVIYISHFLEEVLAVSDSVTILRDGERVAAGPREAFYLDTLAAQIVGESAAEPAHPVAQHGEIGRAILELKRFGAAGRPGSTLTVHAGEIVGLAGLVGSGRTSLAEAICAATPSQGQMSIDGRSVKLKSPAAAVDHGIVLVPEDRKQRGLVMTSSAGANIVLAALGRALSTAGIVNFAARKSAIEQAIAKYGIRGSDLADKSVQTLSGGNQQKVLLARADAAMPAVLILDQPTAGVDIGAKKDIYAHIRTLARGGIACILVSDELEEILSLCNRVAIVKEGAVVEIKSVAGLSQHELLASMSRGRVKE